MLLKKFQNMKQSSLCIFIDQLNAQIETINSEEKQVAISVNYLILGSQ